ncbi:MAG: NAD(P)(+) transhydrogenase (Re/Si-specific) subunit beta [Alphaproteobacteria bacterium]|nr:NAD(P)(+) transhydrogenase (Re/Si-specific) subunit beta [Alphaproteobacteria bacterium]
MMIDLLYLIAAVCFILALKGLSSPESATSGNFTGIVGMVFACLAAYLSTDLSNMPLTLLAICIGGSIGVYIARSLSMTALPEMVAGFHSLVGMAAVLVAFAAYYAPNVFNIMGNYNQIYKSSLIEMGLGVAIGAITFSGSLIAFAKLHEIYKGNNVPKELNIFLGSSIVCLLIYFVLVNSQCAFWILTVLSFILGATLIMPIGGADMPVVVSMLNSYSGWAASGIGFTLHNDLLIITGALVGASGAILSYIMCKGMNRSLFNVIFPSGDDTYGTAKSTAQVRPYKQGSPEDAAFILKNAKSVIVVPGYGMATSQAQHALKEMGDILKKNGTTVRYAIHPVAGRMPGHMNVLLAEANVPYEDVFELDEINRDFATCDVAYVIGANDVTNPAAKNDPSSSIYGMPIFEVDKAKIVLFLKRSMGTGYAGVDNELFYSQNTMMLLGDAKKTTESIVKAM